MSTGSILSILAYPQYGYHLVYQTGLGLVDCSYLSVGSLQFLYVEQKLGSYCRVSGAYLSHLVSTHDECVKFEYQRPLTIFMIATDGSIFPASDMFLRAFS